MTDQDTRMNQLANQSSLMVLQIREQAAIIKNLRWRLHCRNALCRRLVKTARAERAERKRLERWFEAIPRIQENQRNVPGIDSPTAP